MIKNAENSVLKGLKYYFIFRMIVVINKNSVINIINTFNSQARDL